MKSNFGGEMSFPIETQNFINPQINGAEMAQRLVCDNILRQ